MKNALFIALLLGVFGISTSHAQSVKYTKIVDPGKIMSTPNLCTKKDWMSMLIQQIGKDFAEQLCPYAEESKWPSAIDKFDKRQSGGLKKMKDYNCYYLADLPNNNVLLWISLEDNTHMPKKMRDNTDFLVCIWASACALGDKIKLDNINGEEPEEDNGVAAFASQLNEVLKDFEHNFSHIKGEKIPENEISLGNEYQSKLQLEGVSEPCYLSESLGGAMRFIASFGEYSDKDQAVEKLAEIITLIDHSDLPCCTFAKSELFVSDQMVSQSYLPFDTQNKMSAAQERVLLEVEMIKGVDFKDNKLVDNYMVILRVVAQPK